MRVKTVPFWYTHMSCQRGQRRSPRLQQRWRNTWAEHNMHRGKTWAQHEYTFYIQTWLHHSQDGLGSWGTHTPLKLSSLGLNPDPAINCHSGVSQAGWFISACAALEMDVKLLVLKKLSSCYLISNLNPEWSPFESRNGVRCSPNQAPPTCNLLQI